MYNTVTSLFVNDTCIFHLRFCLRFVLHNWMYSLNKYNAMSIYVCWNDSYLFQPMHEKWNNSRVIFSCISDYLPWCISLFNYMHWKKKISVTMHSKLVLFTNNLISLYAWNLFFFQESYSQSVSTLYSEISPNLYDIKQYFHGGCAIIINFNIDTFSSIIYFTACDNCVWLFTAPTENVLECREIFILVYDFLFLSIH